MAASDTGLRIRGFEVWAQEPDADYWFRSVALRLPGLSPTAVYLDPKPPQFEEPKWCVGVVLPDGQTETRQWGFGSREDAESFRSREPSLGLVEAEVRVEKDESGWRGATVNVSDTPSLQVDLTRAEAAEIALWIDQADRKMGERKTEVEKAKDRLRARAPEEAAKYDERGALIFRDPPRPTELVCLECGAEYDAPGHVEDGGMACDRCG